MDHASDSKPRFDPLGFHGLLALLSLEFLIVPMVELPGTPTWAIIAHSLFRAVVFMLLVGPIRHPVLVTVCIGSVTLAVLSRLVLGSNFAADCLAFASIFVVVVVAIQRTLRLETVTSATMSSVLALYLLIGMLWSHVYNGIEAVRPGSFLLAASPAGRADLHYFSYVTMTTLGYGDVIPTHAVGRSLAVAQALVGQVFIAVGIGRLVAVHVATSRGR